MLSRWRREQIQGGVVFAGKGNTRDEELVELKRNLARLTKEREFLHEAATYLAKVPKLSAR